MCPFDVLAGTSMGSIVGGGFAAGATPSEMQRLMTRTDWNDVFVGRPPRGEIAIRRKLDDYKIAEFGLRDGSLLLPKGLVAGVSIEKSDSRPHRARRCCGGLRAVAGAVSSRGNGHRIGRSHHPFTWQSHSKRCEPT